MRQCKVLVNNIEAGILQETDERKYIFTYHEGYSGKPVCIAMPIRRQPYHSDYLFPYFFNMLSEGENRMIQSRLLHIDEKDDFGIMLATAQYDTIGAVTVKPINE